jgi:hypothetical protein
MDEKNTQCMCYLLLHKLSNTRTKYQTKPRLINKKQTKFNLRKYRKKFFEKNLNKKQYKMDCEEEWGDLSLWGRSLCKNNDC